MKDQKHLLRKSLNLNPLGLEAKGVKDGSRIANRARCERVRN
jgi:hypothetical protein